MKKNHFKLRLFRVIIFLAFILITPSLYSQSDIERATRETDRLGRKETIEEQLRKLPEKPAKLKLEEAPLREEEQRFFVKKINLVGCESFPPERFSSIIAKYENKELTFSQLESLTKDIEQEYLKQGVIAAVFMPPQEIIEQTVTLRVVEARMGELQIQDHKYFSKKRLNYYWKIPSGEILHYDKISKSIQMMNRNPDREVKAALHAGKILGTTDVLLTPKTRFPLHFTSAFDREGTPSTGVSRQSYGIRHNNFLGLDDTLITGYTFGNDFAGSYTYHSLPISPNGTSILYGYSRSVSAPKKDYAAYMINSEAKNITFSLHQDLYKRDDYLGEVFVGFDANDKTTIMNTGTSNRDRLRILSLGTNLTRRNFGNTTNTSLEFSQGVKAFGASSKNNPLASRGAKSTFSKFNLGIQYRRILPLNLQANIKFKTQVSSTKLPPQEEFSLGGIDSVRGYPAGDYSADRAVSNSLELLIPSFFIPQNWRLPYAENSLREQTTGLVFLDYGWGRRRGALSTEKDAVTLLGMGTGVRISLFNQALLRLEWGFPVASNRPVSEAGHSRFHFSLDFQEKLPEEIERIRKIIEEENIKQWAWQLVNEELSRPESPLRKKLYDYLYLAEIYHEQGSLKKSKESYEKIVQIGRSLDQQAEDYVRGCLVHQKELREYHRLAAVYYKQGKVDEAKQLWQKIIEEGETKPLSLEF